jgi:hypothetical protein
MEIQKGGLLVGVSFSFLLLFSGKENKDDTNEKTLSQIQPQKFK